MTADPIIPVTMRPAGWEMVCPACENVQPVLDVEEYAGGSFAPDGPERYPLCDACGTQVEILAMRVDAVAAEAEDE